MKVALIRKQENSKWVSCRSITDNIETCYRSQYKDQVSTFQINQSSDKFQMYEQFKKIQAGKFDIVALIDHKPPPANIFKSMDLAFGEYNPGIVVHVFGDFTLHSSEWSGLDFILKKRPLKFITASDSQRSLLTRFCAEKSLGSLPFPVAKNFSYDVGRRETIRKRWNVDVNQLVFLYTGRISTQKNVMEMIRAFDSANRQFNMNAKLVVCGEFDDLGIPFIGKVMPEGTSQYNFIKQVLLHGESVFFAGNMDQDELAESYAGADCFISLSTHNDEDYGMSPAEAMASGLPCILSKWGGFISFKNISPKNVELIDVNFEEGRILPDLTKFMKSLASFKIMAEENRIKYSASVRDKLSPEKLGASLSQALSVVEQFEGFNQEFKKFAGCFELNPKAPFRSGTGSYTDYFKSIYESYRGTE